MNQESGRRRSSRLAARGVTTPKSETPAKKLIKTVEKPKRTKRKTTEDVVELPDAKKSKTEVKRGKTILDDEDFGEENEVISFEENENISVSTTPEKADKIEEESEEPPVEKKTEEPVPDSKEQIDKIPIAKDEKENVDTSPLKTVEKKPLEVIEEPKIAEESVDEQEKSVQEIAPENTNGTIDDGDDDKDAVGSSKEIVNDDVGDCVAVKDTVTSNGDSDAQIKTTNGDKSMAEPETIKVLHDNTNHVVEADIKAVNAATAITISDNDASNVEQVEKETDKVEDIAVDNEVVSADDTAPTVEPSSTVAS